MRDMVCSMSDPPSAEACIEATCPEVLPAISFDAAAADFVAGSRVWVVLVACAIAFHPLELHLGLRRLARLVVWADITDARKFDEHPKGRGSAIPSTPLNKARICKRKSNGVPLYAAKRGLRETLSSRQSRSPPPAPHRGTR